MTPPLDILEAPAIPWTEANIARALALQVFARKYLVMVPNCNWTGYECDLLAITPDLRIVDIEVKISRSDLKADAKKYKWWHHEFKGYGPEQETFRNGRLVARTREPIYEKTARTWPPKVWKHYYAIPREIWKPELIDSLPSKSSGLILLRQHEGMIYASIERRAVPNRDAKAVEPADAIDLARLASLRMWNTYQALEAERAKVTS
jgi:hypothetical protein